jgi:predicted dehydrogenase
MKELSWGIIGCGDVTEVKSGPAFNKVPHSRLLAVMRRNAEKARDYARRHGVPKWYQDAEDLVNDPGVNAVYIATPPLYHEAYALMCIAAGKPVYIEKPVTLDAASARRIDDAARRSGIKVSIAHYRRQQPLFLKIKDLLDTGAIGKVQTVSLQLFLPHKTSVIAQTEEPWRLDPAVSGGGLFHDLSPHQLDLMLYYFGKVKKMKGMAVNTAGLYEAADTVSGQAYFESGVFFNGSWCFTVPSFQKTDRCTITGSGGILSFSIFDQNPLQMVSDAGEQIFHFDTLQHVQQPMIEQVVRYFLDQAQNPCSTEEGVAVMEVIDAFTKASE